MTTGIKRMSLATSRTKISALPTRTSSSRPTTATTTATTTAFRSFHRLCAILIVPVIGNKLPQKMFFRQIKKFSGPRKKIKKKYFKGDISGAARNAFLR